MSKFKLRCGDNIELLKKLPDNSIDAIVSDPPYGLSFMGKKWDYDVPSVEFWKEVYRVLKPGGHVLSFGGTRTYHRMVVNIEDAGFEIRDQIMWLYGSGFPKSHNISKAMDKLDGVAVPKGKAFSVVGQSGQKDLKAPTPRGEARDAMRHKPTNSNALKWEGWGTALKPANEPICLARKPLSEKSVAENVLKWRTGGINIDGCRVNIGAIGGSFEKGTKEGLEFTSEGRFPANIILECICDDKGDIHTNPMCPCRLMDEQSSGASRFFYQAKVSKKERNMGLDGFEDKIIEGRDEGQDDRNVAYKPRPVPQKNTHPTVKPVQLMAYLCRLVTPQGGTILDPYMGSGSTGIAAMLEGFNFIGFDLDPDYFKIAEARITNYEKYREFLKNK